MNAFSLERKTCCAYFHRLLVCERGTSWPLEFEKSELFFHPEVGQELRIGQLEIRDSLSGVSALSCQKKGVLQKESTKFITGKIKTELIRKYFLTRQKT